MPEGNVPSVPGTGTAGGQSPNPAGDVGGSAGGSPPIVPKEPAPGSATGISADAIRGMTLEQLAELDPRIAETLKENHGSRAERRRLEDDRRAKLESEGQYKSLYESELEDRKKADKEKKAAESTLKKSEAELAHAKSVRDWVGQQAAAKIASLTPEQQKALVGPTWPKDDPLLQLQAIDHFLENQPPAPGAPANKPPPLGGKPAPDTRQPPDVEVTEKSSPLTKSFEAMRAKLGLGVK